MVSYQLFVILALSASCVFAKLSCKTPILKDFPQKWISMEDECIRKMKNQVNEELTAAVTYLAMGAHFAQDSINRPGFSSMFFQSASEEREHAIKILEYLLMRGELTSKLSDIIRHPVPLKDSWKNGAEALHDALNLETSVTAKIRDIIQVCETPASNGQNDYHLVDYLTGDFLEEQYKGQRDIAGKLSTLGKMKESHGVLGEFLFDKKLLNGEL